MTVGSRLDGKPLSRKSGETPKAATVQDRVHRLLDQLWSGESRWTMPERACFYAVVRRFGKNGCAWPSLKTIAADAGCTERTAGKCLRVLVNGCKERDLPPVLTRTTRHREDGRPGGFTYHVVHAAERLQRARERIQIQTAAIAGKRMPAGPRATLDPDLEDRAEQLRRDKGRLDGDLIQGKITEAQHAQRLKRIEREQRKLARA